MRTKYIFLSLVVLFLVPTFIQMLRPGIFSMQDFHLFRLIEFDKCIKALQIPCRWAPDAGAGYGEPIFNFYGQFVYIFGEIFHLLQFSLINSLKITFIFSLLGSGITMFFLARKIWGNNYSALVSSTLYLYAPYRAVDVWVRGALPEAFSFVLFPLVILYIEKYLEKQKPKDLLLFSLALSLLIITHNLSLVLFAPFLIIWLLFRFMKIRNYKPFFYLFLGFLISFLLSSFYVLPVIFESKYVDINSTTIGYFDWRAHFVTLKQLFIERNWGYGASTWGNEDGLSLSIGQVQVGVVLIIGLIVFLKRKLSKDVIIFFILVIISIFALFLTHNKSTFIWQNLLFMKYLQFPWRFLGVSLFSLSIASGLIAKLVDKKIMALLATFIIFIVVLLNISFFRPDIWYSVDDSYFLVGEKWDEARFASIRDYWPNFGHEIPNKISDGRYINYFPGWDKEPNQDGLIISDGAKFRNTAVRNIGNILSLVSFTLIIGYFVKLKYAKNSRI